MASERASDPAFFLTCALLFVVSAALTIIGCESMSTMDGMPMPGGWTMSMTWMRMPGQTWSAAAASFLGMWIVMMVAMMLPTVMPGLWRYRQSMGRTDPAHAGRLTSLVGVGYFCVWAGLGIVTYPLGVLMAAVEMQQPLFARAVPWVTGIVILIIGAIQMTGWKVRRLACCRHSYAAKVCAEVPDGVAAWRYGVRLGFQCSGCCANLMGIALLVGIMDLCAMAAVGVAIVVERLAPPDRGIARTIGGIVIVAGLGLLIRAISVT
jgi:predicted metal-binding membrane protein